ncbi:MAG: hypothetical protein AB1467_04540 [Candidatus Diapherotrites archaeon]
MKAKGQVALEYLFLTVLLLIIVGILFVYSLVIYNDSLNSSKAQNYVQQLANAADQASAWGPGTKLYVEAELPGGVQSVIATNKSITVKVQMLGGVSDIYTFTKADITPVSLPTTQGLQALKVEMVDANIVISTA